MFSVMPVCSSGASQMNMFEQVHVAVVVWGVAYKSISNQVVVKVDLTFDSCSYWEQSLRTLAGGN